MEPSAMAFSFSSGASFDADSLEVEAGGVDDSAGTALIVLTVVIAVAGVDC